MQRTGIWKMWFEFRYWIVAHLLILADGLDDEERKRKKWDAQGEYMRKHNKY